MNQNGHVLSLLQWSPWQPLFGSWLEDRLPSLPGIYRIRRAGHSELDYIGQTGAGNITLKQRIGMLREIYKPVMPYRAPHTAGPALWALRQASGSDGDFEVSTLHIEKPTPWREGLKCAAISIYRQEHGASPTANFGRMPLGYRMSSGNNAHLAATNRRYRGGESDVLDENHVPGIAPISSLTGDPVSPSWCEHAWSSWQPILAVDQGMGAETTGLYRIRQSGQAELHYIGQGRVYTRLQAYTSNPQGERGQLDPTEMLSTECSWVLNGSWLSHQRLELVCDLIGAYMLCVGEVPIRQYR